MNKTFLMFRHEFLHTIKGTGFLILTFIVPVLALLSIGIFKLVTVLIEPSAKDVTLVGYVDEVGIFNEQTDLGVVKMVPYESREEATQALVRQDVSEMIIIPVDYISSGTIQRYTKAKELLPNPVTIQMVESYLTWNLLKDDIPTDVIVTIVTPLNVESTRLDENGEVAQEQGNVGDIIIPATFALLLSLSIMIGASSLIGGLGEEKESRLIEVLFSSVSIRQLLYSKILALGTAGLLQVLVWLISIPLLLQLASSTFGGFLSEIQLPANFIILGIIYFVLGYLLFAILSVTVGGISSNPAEAQGLAMIYMMMLYVPLWFAGLLFNFPNNLLWVVLSIFPFTAPVQVMLRLGVSEVPAWQIQASISVLILSILFVLSFSTRIFRSFMLMYGKRPSLSQIVRGLKAS